MQLGVRSDLPTDELKRVVAERAGDVCAASGFVHRFDGIDPATGELLVFVRFATRADAEAFLASDVRKGFAAVYRASDAVRVRKFEILGEGMEGA